jgi:hypothetical protein
MQEQPPDKSRVAGYEPEDLLRAPLNSPHPQVPPAESKFLRKKVKPPERISIILGIVGVGFILLDVWALLFLPAFTLSSVLIMAIVGILLFAGGFIAKLVR